MVSSRYAQNWSPLLLLPFFFDLTNKEANGRYHSKMDHKSGSMKRTIKCLETHKKSVVPDGFRRLSFQMPLFVPL